MAPRAAVEKSWPPPCLSMASLRAVASLDPRPDTVEDVLNVCPQQASSFGGRHLRLVWFRSLPVERENWPGREGVARLRIDSALGPNDPAVLLIAGVPGASDRDPIIQLAACAIPPHFVQPWATVEVMLDAAGKGAGVARNDGGSKIARNGFARDTCGIRHTTMPIPALRPESALELLRGAVVRGGCIIHYLASPTDPACRGVRLRCKRAAEFTVPYGVSEAPQRSEGRNCDTKEDAAEQKRNRGDVAGRQQDGFGHQGRRQREGRERRNKTDHDHRDIESTKRGNRGVGREYGTEMAKTGSGRDRTQRRRRRVDVAETDESTERETAVRAGGKQSIREGDEGADEGGGWSSRMRDWGVVTTCTKMVVPNSALEVRYYDADDGGRDPEDASGEGKEAGATEKAAAAECPSWVESVLESHDPALVRDLAGSLELAEVVPGFSNSDYSSTDRLLPDLDDREEKSLENRESIEQLGTTQNEGQNGWKGGIRGSGNGAVLLHGVPGVGKTLLVEALAVRLRCRLVKVFPGRLAAAGGVEADRVLADAFGYCRLCVSNRVLLLLDSVDRLVPASDGGVGASRGEVDAGILNSLVLAVEEGRGDSKWEGRVAMVLVTSWPEKMHPSARRCAGQEVVVLPPSQPLRARVLRRAIFEQGEGGSNTREDRLDSGLEEAVADVVELCQGFTAGDVCAIAASYFHMHRHARSSKGDTLRAAFRQVRLRVGAGRGGGGAGGGSGASVAGVPSIRWSEVGGLERAKRAVQEMVVWPTRHPEVFSRMGITPASGVLLFGPPGTGKTLLAKAAATETGATFIELKISDVVRGEIGESEKAIDRAFRTARELAPSIVFIDEFQALFASREVEGATGSRLASQLLVCMDELARWRSASFRQSRGTQWQEGEQPFSQGEIQVDATNVMVLAATNAPEAIDSAFLRPGRFDEIVYAGLPDTDGRRHILQAAKNRMEGQDSQKQRTLDVVATPTTPIIDGRSRRSTQGPSNQLPPQQSAPIAVTHIPTEAGLCIDTTNEIQTNTIFNVEHPVYRKSGSASSRKGGWWANDVDIDWLSRETKGYSGADLSSLIRNAAMAALCDHFEDKKGVVLDGGEHIGPAATTGDRSIGSSRGETECCLELARKHFEAALESTRPSSGAEAISKHEGWARQWHVA